MRFKSILAPSMAEALETIRDELGADAVILSSQTADDGRLRVIAAADAAGPTAAPSTETRRRQAALPASQVIADALFWHRTPEQLIALLVASGAPADNPERLLAARLETLFRFDPLEHRQPSAILFAGPPGSGKTMATAKLAARARFASRPVCVISTDTARTAAYEELAAITGILDLPLGCAENGAELRALLAAVPPGTEVLIDSGAVNPLSDDDRARLCVLLDGTPVEPVLVLPAGLDAEEAADTARAFAGLGVARLIASRLDAARRLGGLLAAAAAGPLAFAEGLSSPFPARGIAPLSAETLAQLLLRGGRPTTGATADPEPVP